MALKTKVQINYKSNIRELHRHVNEVMERRLDAISEKMVKELKTTVSKPGPSKPGNPPGITQRSHDRRVPGGLMKSISYYKAKEGTKSKRHIGTPLPRGLWLELGVSGGTIIRPIRSKALLVPVPGPIAQSMLNKPRGQSGTGGRKFLGLVQHPDGKWYALMRYVVQGPIAPRPWLKPTFFKNLRKIGLTLSQRIN